MNADVAMTVQLEGFDDDRFDVNKSLAKLQEERVLCEVKPGVLKFRSLSVRYALEKRLTMEQKGLLREKINPQFLNSH